MSRLIAKCIAWVGIKGEWLICKPFDIMIDWLDRNLDDEWVERHRNKW